MVAYFLVSLHKSSLPLHAEWSVLQRFYYKSECLKVLMTKVTKMPEILLSELPALYYGVGKKISAVQKTFQRFFYSVFAVGFGIQSNTVNTGSNEESFILYCNLPECNNGNALSVFV